MNGPPSGEGCDPQEGDVRVTCVVCPEGNTGVLGALNLLEPQHRGHEQVCSDLLHELGVI